MTELHASLPPSEKPRSRLVLAIWVILLLILTALLIGLGTWQVERLHWKLDLIARVDARVHAPPQPAPPRAEWSKIDTSGYEYSHVTAAGVLMNDKESLVYASTDLGPGYWVLTPLQQGDGTIVLVNRGFVPLDHRDPATRTPGQVTTPVTVTGLLRISEPKGTFLRSNDPADDRWYSRDVAAMAAKHGLSDVAPYFIDADAAPNPGGLPVGGLTQVVFPNSHFSYAITWYCLATMALGLAGFLVYSERTRSRRLN